jgi:hypothetical protein
MFRGVKLGYLNDQFCESAAEIRTNPNLVANLGVEAGVC